FGVRAEQHTAVEYHGYSPSAVLHASATVFRKPLAAFRLTFIRTCSARQPSREVPWAAWPLNSHRVATRRLSTIRRRTPRLRPSTGLARHHAARPRAASQSAGGPGRSWRAGGGATSPAGTRGGPTVRRSGFVSADVPGWRRSLASALPRPAGRRRRWRRRR